MTNTMFDVFAPYKSAKIVWESLESKYGSGDAGKKKHVVGKWLQFIMEDGKPIMEQVQINENLCADVTNEGMKFVTFFLLMCCWKISLLPGLTIETILSIRKKTCPSKNLHVEHMRTEEASRLKDTLVSIPVNAAKVNMVVVETGGPFNAKNYKRKGKARVGQAKNQGPAKKNERKSVKANVTVTDDVIAVMVVEANLVGNVAEWVLDTGAARHLCADKGLFAEFEEVADRECVYMGNYSSALIIGKDSISNNIAFTSTYIA
ncbi:uncharacterized protein LOC141645125 [Silene latifolia]|uniref:uncharacterized protein LOC141645125 n=1 Tax=Silene latifolia TaxID=37657 RepID=UPI003D77818C